MKIGKHYEIQKVTQEDFSLLPEGLLSIYEKSVGQNPAAHEHKVRSFSKS